MGIGIKLNIEEEPKIIRQGVSGYHSAYLTGGELTAINKQRSNN